MDSQLGMMCEAHRRALTWLERDNGRLWGPIEPRWIFCAQEHWYLTEEVSGAEPLGALWRIPAPDGLTANASTAFAGKVWAQITSLDRQGPAMDVLMLHELFHATVQQARQLSGQMPAPGDELTTVEGKALFFAELQAWMNAIADPGLLGDAIAIRNHRQSKTSVTEWERQLGFEIAEGLAEYSGIVWAQAPLSYLEDRIERGKRLSMARAGAYRIGPAMGLALDAAGIEWRSSVQFGCDLASYAQTPPSKLDEALMRVGYKAIYAEISGIETEAAVGRQRRARAFAGPLLRVAITNLYFDPTAVEPSPLGTLYVSAQAHEEYVDIDVHDGIVVAEDYSTAYLACPVKPAARASHLEGPGWSATFAAAWESFGCWLGKGSAETNVR